MSEDASIVSTPAARKVLALAAWLPGAFWCVYAVSHTMVDGPPALGRLTAIDALYVLMLPATVLLALEWRRTRYVPGLMVYAGFMLWVLVSLLWRDPASGADVPKRIVICSLFGLAAAQVVAARRTIRILTASFILASSLVAGWVVWHAVRAPFAVRGGLPANPNEVSALLAPGLFAGVALYFDGGRWRRGGLALALLCWYALLLLESRGALLAVLVAVLVIGWRVRPRASRVRTAIISAAAALVLSRVPYAANCVVHANDCFSQRQLVEIGHLGDRIRGFVTPRPPTAAPSRSAAAPPVRVNPAPPAVAAPAPAAPAAAPPRAAAAPQPGGVAAVSSADRPATPAPPAPMTVPSAPAPRPAAPASPTPSAGSPAKPPAPTAPRPLPRPDAPIVTNVGEGHCDPTLRYYRIAWVETRGRTVVRRSEPSPSVPFAPSGSGAAVLITRPAPPNAGETDWTLESSADGRAWNDPGIHPIAQLSARDSWAVVNYPSQMQKSMLFGRLDGWSTVSVRTKLWQGGVRALVSGVRPMLFGSGMGMSDVVATRTDPEYASMHNAPLEVLIDFGLLGMVLFTVFHWQILRALYARSGWVESVFLGGVVFWLVFGLSGTVTDLHTYWLFIGAGAAVAWNPSIDSRNGEPSPDVRSRANPAAVRR